MGAEKPASLMLRTHCQTSGWSLAAQEPHNNIVRTTVEAMAAVFGGTQSLHTNAFDEALALPSDFAARVARNTQLIIQEETHVTGVVDPWAGSYLMERLTQDLADRAWEIVEQVEQQGGMTRAAESGWAKLQIERCAAEQQARLDAGRDVVVGVNKYGVAEGDEAVEIRTIDNSAVLAVQKRRLREVKAARDDAAVAAALDGAGRGRPLRGRRPARAHGRRRQAARHCRGVLECARAGLGPLSGFCRGGDRRVWRPLAGRQGMDADESGRG